MSTSVRDLPLPPQEAHEEMLLLMRQYKNLDIPAITALIKKHPALMRSDQEWRDHFKRSPWIESAIAYNSPELVKAMLDAGCSPFDDDPNIIFQPFPRPVSANFIAITEALAMHRDCNLFVMKDERPVFDRLAVLYKANNSKALAPSLRQLFLNVLERTPDAAFKTMLVSPVTNLVSLDEKPPGAEENAIFAMRAMVDRGISFDELQRNEVSHCFRETLRRGPDYYLLAAAMLAAGLDESCKDFSDDSQQTIGQLIDIDAPGLRAEAKQMLNDEISRVTSGELSAQQLLITPAGRASWQAQGLLMRGRIMELFAPECATYFGGEQQAVCALTLDAVFSAKHRTRFNLAGILRDAPLARPSHSAVVEYLRGGVAADVAQRGGAA